MNEKAVRDCLIIESEDHTRELLVQYCREMNTFRNITVALDGLEATLKLEKQQYHLIIIDLNLPKKDGLRVIESLKTTRGPNKKTKIIVVSMDLRPGQLKKTLSLGIKNLLFDPFDQEKFSKKVLSALSEETKLIPELSDLLKK